MIVLSAWSFGWAAIGSLATAALALATFRLAAQSRRDVEAQWTPILLEEHKIAGSGVPLPSVRYSEHHRTLWISVTNYGRGPAIRCELVAHIFPGPINPLESPTIPNGLSHTFSLPEVDIPVIDSICACKSIESPTDRSDPTIHEFRRGHGRCWWRLPLTDTRSVTRPIKRASAGDCGVQYISLLEDTFDSSFEPVAGRGEASQILQEAGPGSRAIIYGSPRGVGEVGHVFNAVNQAGVVNFIDFQAGTEASFEGYRSFQILMTSRGG